MPALLVRAGSSRTVLPMLGEVVASHGRGMTSRGPVQGRSPVPRAALWIRTPIRRVRGECMRHWVPGVAALAAAAVLSAAPPAGAQERGPIAVAALYNLTSGGQSSLDGPSFNGLKLKARMINDAGGLLGGRKLEVTAFDTRNDP